MLSYPHWCQESSTISSDGAILWTPMWKYDSDILEIENDSHQQHVYVHNRREKVDLPQRKLSSCYDSTLPSKRIIRGTWFYYYTPTKTFFPFFEDVANRIELWFQSLKALTPTNGEPIRAEVEMLLPLPHRVNGESVKYKLSAVKEIPAPQDSKVKENLIDGFVVTMRSIAFNDFFSGPIQLERGFRYTPDPEEAWCGTEVDHVVFVVHGIGQTMFAKSDANFKNNISSIRKLTMEQQEALFQTELEQLTGSKNPPSSSASSATASTATSSSLNSNSTTPSQPPTILSQYGNKKRIEYLPIEWFNIVRTEDSPLTRDLSLVTLPNIQVVRQIANEVVLDILLYLTPKYREKILTYVCAKIVELFSIFIELNPTFLQNHGKCSLIGHSLGTVILFDLLSNQRRESRIGTLLNLPFRPHAFLALGSPLGLFLSIRNSSHSMMFEQPQETSNTSSSVIESNSIIEDAIVSQCFAFPTCLSFFNLFHPHDPVAYRIEPLLDPALSSKNPVVVVHHKGGFRPHYLIKNIATQITDTVNIVFNPAGWFGSKLTSTSTTSQVNNYTSSTPAASTSSTSSASSASTGSYSSSYSSSSSTSSSSSSNPSATFAPDNDRGQSISQKRLEECPAEIPHVALNSGRRIDYMLQETGLENANEYISSITSHTGYFDMKDVARFFVVNIW